MATDDTLITLLPEFEYTKANIGSYRNRPVAAVWIETGRWILERWDGGEVLSASGNWEPAGALLSRNVLPVKAMIFTGPDAALNHLRSVAFL